LAGKHRKEKSVRKPTKHQVTRWEKEKKLSRIITIVTACIIAAVLGIIGYWVYAEQVMPYQQTAVKVNDKSFDTDYYIKMLDAYTKGQSSDMVKYYVDIVAQAIPQTTVVIEGAQGAGITFSDDEVSKEIELLKLPDNAVSKDMMRARVITRKYNEQQCLPKQPATVEQAEVQAMLLETKFMADERRQKLILGDNFSTMAAMLSIDSVTQSKKGYLGWIPRGYEDKALETLKDSILKNVVFTLDTKTVSDPIYDENVEKPFGYWVIEVLEKDATKGVHARGILFSSKDDAESVRTRLINGDSWDALAKQYSQHVSRDKAGDLDWIVPGFDKSQLASIVGAIEKGKISNVVMDSSVKTKGGYWLVQVLNKQERPLSDSIKQALSEECLNAWIMGLMDKAKVENKLDQKQKDFAVGKVLKGRSQ
jgi:parvulin-like peptidyl-prolyl isomerase